jgi:hypothetical protein
MTPPLETTSAKSILAKNLAECHTTTANILPPPGRKMNALKQKCPPPKYNFIHLNKITEKSQEKKEIIKKFSLLLWYVH